MGERSSSIAGGGLGEANDVGKHASSDGISVWGSGAVITCAMVNAADLSLRLEDGSPAYGLINQSLELLCLACYFKSSNAKRWVRP